MISGALGKTQPENHSSLPLSSLCFTVSLTPQNDPAQTQLSFRLCIAVHAVLKTKFKLKIQYYLRIFPLRSFPHHFFHCSHTELWIPRLPRSITSPCLCTCSLDPILLMSARTSMHPARPRLTVKGEFEAWHGRRDQSV